ncbi:MAG: 4-hydroxy-tetrahydrodipicolinate reductase [Alphaproteobacteria bacterium]|jgi:4-hydroxy-tetrahydrodipicolinate reductase
MKIGIAGANGQMGYALITTVNQQLDYKLSVVLVRKPDNFTYKYLVAEDVIVTNNIKELCNNSEVIIDFSSPELTLKVAELAAKNKIPVVSGTTGFSNKENDKLKNYAKLIPIVHTGNMSIGVNLMETLVAQVAKSLGEDFDVEIIEKHHKNKVDAPSGTALMLAKSITDARNISFKDNIICSREGHVGVRPANKIGISSVRGGNITGEHDVMFISDSEVITISHHAFSRNIFANGAIKACEWVINQSPGLYSMQDVLRHK